MPKIYELFLHAKQGDDFANCLEHAQGDTSAALQEWASAFASMAQVCRTLAERLKGLPLDVNADTHTIAFDSGDPAAIAVLEALAKEELLSVYDWEEDEEDEEDDASIFDEATYKFWNGVGGELEQERINVLIAESDEHAEVIFKQTLPRLEEQPAAIFFLIRADVEDIHYVDDSSEDDSDSDSDSEDDLPGSLIRFLHVPKTLAKEELIPGFIAFFKAHTCDACGGETP